MKSINLLFWLVFWTISLSSLLLDNKHHHHHHPLFAVEAAFSLTTTSLSSRLSTTTTKMKMSSNKLFSSSSTAEDDFSNFAASLEEEPATAAAKASSSSSSSSSSSGATTAATMAIKASSSSMKPTTRATEKKLSSATTTTTTTTTTTNSRMNRNSNKNTNNNKNKKKTWQEDLEELLDPQTPLAQKQILMSVLIQENAEIRASVQKAIRDRKIDPLLTPTGKKLQDGTRAVARQLTNDILPSIARPAAAAASSSSSSSSPGAAFPLPLPPFFLSPPLDPDQITKTGTRILNALQNQVQTGLQNMQQDLQDPARRIPQRLISTRDELWQEATNLFAETPAGLQEPPYTVVETTADYEIRDYPGYTVACTNMLQDDVDESSSSSASSSSSSNQVPENPATAGAAFNSLAAYLFGANKQGIVMEMTTPVTTTMTGEMRFYLAPISKNDNKPPPEPLEFDKSRNVYETNTIRIEHIPAARLAVRRFTGFVTAGEIARQKEALLTALQLDDNKYDLDVPHGQAVGHLIFQYNPPYTIPVLRRNEIAVPVVRQDDDSSLSDLWMSQDDDDTTTTTIR